MAVATGPESPSPAHQAGIRVGDVVVAWNGEPVTDPVGLSRQVAQARAGSQATVTVNRAGQVLQLPVTVGQR
jgi:serine protease Do